MREHGLLRIATEGEPLTIESLALDNTDRGAQVGVEHSGARVLVLRDLVTSGVSVQRTNTGGKLFIEDICCGPLQVAGANGVWAEQFNSEGLGTRIVNLGSPLSILGVKTEQNCTVLENFAGAVSDIVGGLIYQVRPPAASLPAFIDHAGGLLYTSYVEEAYIPGSAYAVHVRDERADRSVATTDAAALPARGPLARLMPGKSFGGDR